MFQKKIRMTHLMYLFGLFLVVSLVGFLSKHTQKSGLMWGADDENFLMSSARADGPPAVSAGEGGEGGGGGGGAESGESGESGECGEGCESGAGGGP